MSAAGPTRGSRAGVDGVTWIRGAGVYAGTAGDAVGGTLVERIEGVIACLAEQLVVASTEPRRT